MTQLDCGGEPIGGPTGGQAAGRHKLERNPTARQPPDGRARRFAAAQTAESLCATFRDPRLLRRRPLLRGLDVRRVAYAGALSPKDCRARPISGGRFRLRDRAPAFAPARVRPDRRLRPAARATRRSCGAPRWRSSARSKLRRARPAPTRSAAACLSLVISTDSTLELELEPAGPVPSL